MSILPGVRWLCTKRRQLNLLSVMPRSVVRQTAMSQVAVYQGAEEVTEEPEVMLHMIYV